MESSTAHSFKKGEPSRLSFLDVIRGPREQPSSSTPGSNCPFCLGKEDPRKIPAGCMKVVDGTLVIKVAESDVQANIRELEDRALIVSFLGFKPSLHAFKEWAQKTWNIPVVFQDIGNSIGKFVRAADASIRMEQMVDMLGCVFIWT
ncbi:hypothetical protein KI387_036206 [Taxus chinensis]|uniref:Uncharacterized protein n=1 Tax=Taxus chinensis TaxID=29808 RepID=A0AA38FQC1_TAXCH|nr:hypothetical protein KI387_036206 [Taxus chinensis]